MVEAIRQGDIPGVQLRCRQKLAAPPEIVWRWLTEPARIGAWAGEARLAGGLEGVLELASEGRDGPVRERGRTVELAPARRWVLSFERLDDGWEAATRLTFELTPLAAGSELSVLQQGFEHLPLSRCLTIWESYRRRWRKALALLAAVVAEELS
ncbi:MAG: SRPBCC domain-containing protein [Thermoanaerobaculia bacterium]